MKVLTIGSYQYIEELQQKMNEQFKNITPNELMPVCDIKQGEHIHFLQYSIDDTMFLKYYDHFFMDRIKLHATSAVTDIIMKYSRFDMATDILSTEYTQYTKHEKDEIITMVHSFFEMPQNDEDPDLLTYSYKKEILTILMDFLEEHNELILEGFIQFRLQSYKKSLERVVEHVVKEYETQKEYNEFIKLLRYFVEMQESKIDIIHVVGMPDKTFKIFDEYKDEITKQCIEEFQNDLQVNEVNFDDLLVSSLITIAPQNIVIHGFENIENKHLLETINNVFTGKVHFCTQCDICIPSSMMDGTER